MRAIAFAIAMICAPTCASYAMTDPVKTTGGLVSGVALPNSPVRAYKGIPFAKPPVGDLRWRPPRPAAPWDGVRAADTFAPVCMQPAPLGGNSIFTRLFFTPAEPKSEDCLYLNVWTAAASAAEKRPVMVWIPGGGFRGGSASGAIYDGAALARKGVVLVSINYRLWKFGFLALPELSKESDRHTSGNYGMLDQIAALRWIKSNIAAFGGNPDNITIFGQSAGSTSASLLMASPLAKGLFNRVIGESGGAFAPAVGGSPLGRTLQNLTEAERTGSKLMTALGVTSLDALRKKSAADILAVKSANRYDSALPIVDGYFLPAPMQEIFARGRQNDVPLLLGSNSDEGADFPTMHDLASFQADTRKEMGDFAPEFLQLYKAGNDAEARRASETAVRDTKIGWPTWQWANAQAKTGRSNLYYYYFYRHPPAPPNEAYVENLGANLGAYHGAELAYVFGNFVPQEWNWSADDRTFSGEMSDYWVNFAKSGDPNGEGLPTWPKFVPGEDSVMRFGKTIEVGAAPYQNFYRFWDKFAAEWKGKETGQN